MAHRLGLVLHAGGVGREARVRHPLRMAERARRASTKRRSLPAATISGPVFVSNAWNGTTRLLPVRWRSGTCAGGAEARVVSLEPRQAGLEQRGVHDAAAPGLRTPHEGGEHAHRGPHAGAVVEDGGADAGRRPALVAVHHHEAGERLHHRLVAGLELRADRCGRTPTPSSRRAAGSAWVTASAPSPSASSEPGRRFCTSTSASPISSISRATAVLVLEIDGDRALVGVDGEVARRRALVERRAPAAGVVALGPLDLDDVGAHVGEDLRRPWAPPGSAPISTTRTPSSGSISGTASGR